MLTFPNGGFFYELRDGDTWWITPGEPFGVWIGKIVAILYERHDYVLLKHGSPEQVLAHMAHMKERYSKTGDPLAQQMGDDLATAEITIRGPYEIDRLNRIIGTTGYLKAILSGAMVEV